MRPAGRFIRRPAGDWLLLARVFALVAGFRLALRAVPFAKLRSLLARWDNPSAFARRGEALPDRIRWAMAITRAALPGTMCLPEALTTYLLLRRSGWPASLKIGVARSESAAFQAHAWVECDGMVVAGQRHDLDRYNTIAVSDGSILSPPVSQ